MKALIFALAMLFPIPAFGANCLALVFHDSGQAPPNNLFYQLEPWSDVVAFETNIALYAVAAFHVYYDQFGLQGGPTSYPTWTGDTFVNKYGFRYIITVGPNGLLVKRFLDAASAAQRQARADLFTEAGSISEDVNFQIAENSIGPNSNAVLIGSDVSAADGVTTQELSDDAMVLGERGGTIWTDIVTNGCP